MKKTFRKSLQIILLSVIITVLPQEGLMAEKKEQDFQTFVKENTCAMADFYAQWCGPCRAIAPLIDELAEEFQGKVAIQKFDIDKVSELAAEYDISAVPTFIFFKNGEVVEKISGARTKAEFRRYLKKLL